MEKKISPATHSTDESPTFDVTEFVLFALGRYRYYIIIFVFLGLLVGVKNALKLPNLYASEGEFLVRAGKREKRTPETTLENDGSVQAPGVIEEIHLLNTPPLYLRLAEEMGTERLLEPYDPKFRDTENTRAWVRWVHELQARFFFKGRSKQEEESESAEEVATAEDGGEAGESAEEERDPRFGRVLTPVEAAAKLAQGRTTFDPKKMGRKGDQGSRVIVVRYEAFSPELAQDVVRKLMELCQDRHREIFAAPYQGEFLSKQLAEAVQEEEAARKAFFDHVEECGFFDIPMQKKALHQDIERGENAIYVSTTQRNVIIDELEQIEAELPGLETNEVISATRTNPWINTLYQSLLNVRVQIRNIKFTEGTKLYNDELARLEAIQADIERDIDDQRAFIEIDGGTQDPLMQAIINRRYETLVTKEAELKARLRRFNIEIARETEITEQNRNRMSALLTCEPIHEDLMRETQKTQRRADLLTQKRDDAEVLDLMDQDDQMSNLVFVTGRDLPAREAGSQPQEQAHHGGAGGHRPRRRIRFPAPAAGQQAALSQ